MYQNNMIKTKHWGEIASVLNVSIAEEIVYTVEEIFLNCPSVKTFYLESFTVYK